jgi:hypothetical protein
VEEKVRRKRKPRTEDGYGTDGIMIRKEQKQRKSRTRDEEGKDKDTVELK